MSFEIWCVFAIMFVRVTCLLECTINIGCVLWPWAVVCSWSEVGRSWVEIAAFMCRRSRPARSFYVHKQGGATDFLHKLSGFQLSELFPFRVGISYLGGDLQFTCVVETSSTFTSCI